MSDWDFLNRHRIRRGQFGSDETYGFNGMFDFALSGEARRIRVVASDEGGWQHVSVSFWNNKATPPWQLMCRIKDLFFEPEDCVVQFHPPKSDYVNNHPGCLHLWRVTDGRKFPTPPAIFVGIRGVELV